MTKLSWWKRSLMALGAATAGLAALAAQARPGLSAEPPAPQQGGAAPKFRYFGSKSCADCHAVTKERPTNSTYAIGYIKLDEYLTWSKEDKHSLAFVRLNGKRGLEMARRLTVDPSKPVDVTKPETGCLGCHSAGKAEQNDRNQGVQFDRNEGVSCENCHGPYSGWDTDHRQPYFRFWDAQKRADSGMVDVRVPGIQAGQCLSCHIGNSDEGKVVTHDMYAAGHPPLPSIEIATFCDSIPRHWSLLQEKDDLRKGRPLAANEVMEQQAIRRNAGFQAGDRERTKLAVVGAAVALKTSMKLLADESKQTGGTTVPGLEWPDYARFDCWSCHHDLKRPGWRQARGFPASPGRPPIGEWPLAIVELGIERLEMDGQAGALRAELLGHQKEVLNAATAKPFGKTASLGTAADAFARWADVLISKLSKASYDEAVALKLFRALVAKAEAKDHDYDEARHVAWTLKILAADAGLLPPGDGPKAATRDKINAVLKHLDKGLKLELPAGTKYEIDDQMVQALQSIGDYEPSEFRDNLKELAALIPKE